LPFTVIYDACVLYPAPLRDLLVRLAQTRLFHARWTDRILDETFRSVQERRADLSGEQLARTRELMCKAIPDCLVTGYEDLIEGLELPDPDDRHVLAAAIRAGAQTIVTVNLRDFPTSRGSVSLHYTRTCPGIVGKALLGCNKSRALCPVLEGRSRCLYRGTTG
jgi:hypothetical protein